jgi:hypothetical protein
VSPDNKVIVPADKTNWFATMEVDEYKQKVLRHLLPDGKEIDLQRIVDTHEQATELIEEIEIFCSKGEYDFIKESLKSGAIPSPKLFVKDHKPKDTTWGQYPTRLVIPTRNFTATRLYWYQKYV